MSKKRRGVAGEKFVMVCVKKPEQKGGVGGVATKRGEVDNPRRA